MLSLRAQAPGGPILAKGSCLQQGLGRGTQPWFTLSAQDNQTDSGMVLASEELEQIEDRRVQVRPLEMSYLPRWALLS